MCKVISVSNQKGGVGKTVTCVNLGIGLAREGYKVLMIDADPQGWVMMISLILTGNILLIPDYPLRISLHLAASHFLMEDDSRWEAFMAV